MMDLVWKMFLVFCLHTVKLNDHGTWHHRANYFEDGWFQFVQLEKYSIKWWKQKYLRRNLRLFCCVKLRRRRRRRRRKKCDSIKWIRRQKLFIQNDANKFAAFVYQRDYKIELRIFSVKFMWCVKQFEFYTLCVFVPVAL